MTSLAIAQTGPKYKSRLTARSSIILRTIFLRTPPAAVLGRRIDIHLRRQRVVGIYAAGCVAHNEHIDPVNLLNF